MNPYDDNSVGYPEDVILLAGNVTAYGIVTYSENGDGRINLYNTPSHCPGPEEIDQPMK